MPEAGVCQLGCSSFRDLGGFSQVPRYQDIPIYQVVPKMEHVVVLSPFSTSIPLFARHQQNVLGGSHGCRRGRLADLALAVPVARGG